MHLAGSCGAWAMNWPDMFVNIRSREMPRAIMPAIAAPATSAASSAYSIAVAARRSARSLVSVEVSAFHISRRGLSPLDD